MQFDLIMKTAIDVILFAGILGLFTVTTFFLGTAIIYLLEYVLGKINE